MGSQQAGSEMHVWEAGLLSAVGWGIINPLAFFFLCLSLWGMGEPALPTDFPHSAFALQPFHLWGW